MQALVSIISHVNVVIVKHMKKDNDFVTVGFVSSLFGTGWIIIFLLPKATSFGLFQCGSLPKPPLDFNGGLAKFSV